VIESYFIITIALLASGVVTGILAVFSLGIRRDGRRRRLAADAHDSAARGAGQLIDAGARGTESADEPGRDRRHALPV
jgi:hypothetical protein